MLSESELLSRFRGVNPCGDGWTAHCPAHKDRRQSLTIGRGDKGWVLNCHRGCEFGDIIASTTPPTDKRELFPDNGPGGAAGRREVAVYDYGTYQVVRFEPKHFLQRRPDGKGGYIWNLKGVKPRLYHLDALKGREVVYVVEGEKDADRLWLLNIPATCNSGGAAAAAAARKKWKPTHTEQLVKAGVENVVVIPDADQPGQDHAENVARACAAAGLAVKLVALPEGAKDVSEYLDGAGTVESLRDLVMQTAVYEPARNAPTGWFLLSDVEANAGDGPPVVVRGLAWAGRLTLLHSREKVGKSTLMGAAAAAVTRGAPFLEMPTTGGPVVWFGEEHKADAKTRMDQWGADCRRVAFGNRLEKGPDGGSPSLNGIVAWHKPVLIVVDTLTLFAGILGIRDFHGAGELGDVMANLAALARKTDAAVVVLHHNRKNPSNGASTGTPQGEYRDSTAIAAAADMIVSFDETNDASDTARRLAYKGRWSEPAFVVQLRADGYTVHPDDVDDTAAPKGGRAMADRVRLYLLRCDSDVRPSARDIRVALNCQGRRYTELEAALDSLVDAGEIDHAERTDKRMGKGYALTAAGRPIAEALRQGGSASPYLGGGTAEPPQGGSAGSVNGNKGGTTSEPPRAGGSAGGSTTSAGTTSGTTLGDPENDNISRF